MPQLQWKPHIEYHRKLDDLSTSLEVAELKFIGHSWVANCQTAWRKKRVILTGPGEILPPHKIFTLKAFGG